MQISAVFLLGFSLSLSARTISQTITYSGTKVPFEKIIAVIEKQTGFVVLASKEQLKDADNVTISANAMPIEDFLKKALDGQPFQYEIDAKTIFIKKKAGDLNHRLLSPSLTTPPITVRGRILNEKGEPVIASIIIKGTNRGVNSDSNGDFEIVNVDDKAILIISATNIQSKEISVNGISGNITVLTSSSPLDEVVVNKGYYTESKRKSTGNISRIDTKDISNQPVANVMGTLQGRMPGVYVQQTTGVPGGGFNIQIRGQNSLRNNVGDNGNLPLYIVDGVPFGSTSLTEMREILPEGTSPISFLNPADIENIEILKDADATAIYGSRGANGVVLITTKKGRAGKTKIDFNINSGAGKVSRRMDVLNGKQYLEMRNEAYSNDGQTPLGAAALDLLTWDTTTFTDWQKLLIGRTAKLTNAQLSISGGNEKTQFLAGLGYSKETTVFPGDFRNQRISSHMTINHRSEDNKFRLHLKAQIAGGDNNLPRIDPTAVSLRLTPVSPSLYDENNKLNWVGWSNPLGPLLNIYENKTENIISNITLSYEPISNLILKASAGYTFISVDEFAAIPIASQNPLRNPTGTSFFSHGSKRTLIVEPQIEYRLSRGISKISFLAGGTFQQNRSDSRYIASRGYTSDALLKNLQAAPLIFPLPFNDIQYRYQAFFGRINYGLKDRYLINATFRRDGSSRFGPGKQFATFGAIGAAWVFSEENLFANNSFLSFGKLRASYGTTGSDAIPDYGYLDSYSATPGQYDNIPGLIPTRLVNPDFAWEENKKLEGGIELGFLRDKILFNVSWYRNRSSNQLVGYSLSSVTGQNSIQYNLPATVQNTGWEFDLTTRNVSTKKFSWSSSFNITLPKNKLVDYPNLAGSSYNQTYVIGRSLNLRKVFEFTGVNPSNGVIGYKDTDNDNIISYDNDRDKIVEIEQKFYGGLNNSINYGNVQLDLFFQFVKQNGLNYNYYGGIAPGQRSNVHVELLNRWQKPGDITNFSRFTVDYSSAAAEAYNNITNSDLAISDASFIRLKNVSVSYMLSGAVINRLQLQNARVYVQAQNLFTFTNFKGLDPENMSFSTLPPLKMFTAGINITF